MVNETKLADASSVVRVLNSLHAKIEISNQTIFFKTDNQEFVKDLERLASDYKPLISVSVHSCGEADCSIDGYHTLRMGILPDKHKEAAAALYEVLGKYAKK